MSFDRTKDFLRPFGYALLGATAAISLLVINTTANKGINPRPFNGFTLEQVVKSRNYPRKFFDKHPNYKKHLEVLSETEPDFNTKLKNASDNVLFWYLNKLKTATKKQNLDSGKAMYPYDLIAKGWPGSCSEGTVVMYENMKNTVRIKEGTVKHYLLLFTINATKNVHLDSHVIYMAEITREDKTKEYRIGGINPFEDPMMSYKTPEDAIRRNVNYFRTYAFGGLTDRGILFGPDRVAIIDPETYNVELRVSRAKTPASKQAEAEAIQQRVMNLFERVSQDYSDLSQTK